MYKIPKFSKTAISRNETYEGEPIEHKIYRISKTGEPIRGSKAMIYTEEKHGVNPAHDPRTDTYDLALQVIAKQQEKAKFLQNKGEGKDAETKFTDLGKQGNDGTTESIQGTNQE